MVIPCTTIQHKLSNFMAIALLFLSMITTESHATSPYPVAALDLPIAETLIELRISPVIISQRGSFDFWTGSSYESSKVVEAGTPAPNIELLQEITPYWIFLAPWQISLEQRLSSVSPVKVIDSYPYNGENDVWQRLLAFTQQLGQLTEKRQEADRLIQQSHAHLDDLRERINSDETSFIFIQLWDERHVRVFGKNSLIQAVIQRLGLHNAWPGKTNQWGYSLVGIETLADIEARLVLIQSPSPVSTEKRLEQNAIWHHLSSVRRGDVIVLPNTFWIAGGLPSARRFADALTQALEASDT